MFVNAAIINLYTYDEIGIHHVKKGKNRHILIKSCIE